MHSSNMVKAENDLDRLCKYEPDFLCESGSRLYGTNTPMSDYDLRGFVFPPFEYLLDIKQFKCRELDGDHKIYNVKYFLQLVLKGDPQCTELLFADKKHIKAKTKLGGYILAMKDDLISNAIFSRIMGYSNSEWRKAMGIKVVPIKRKKDKQDIVDEIRNIYHPSKDDMDGLLEYIDAFDKMVTVSSIESLGTRRREDFGTYGYSRKNAAHSIRLVTQVTELMESGTLIFPRPNVDLLMKIRKGELSKDEVQEVYDEVVAVAEKGRKTSVLPDKPNRNRIWDRYTEIVANVIFLRIC